MKELVRWLIIWVGCPVFTTMCLWPFFVWLAPEEAEKRMKVWCWIAGFAVFYGSLAICALILWAFS